MDKKQAKITTSGRYSKAVIIPKEYLRILGWKENQMLDVELDKKNKRLVIRDTKS